jgi:uncharacterized protein (DUF2147 family)
MRLFFLAISLVASLRITAYAQPTPEGLWMSFDDDGKTPTALVRISKMNAQLSGRIEKVLDTTTASEAICSKCKDDRKNQAIVGLEIIRGTKATPQNNQWLEGKILDPDDGKEYKLVLEMQDAGNTLGVRGYWGPFWRTQQWRRQAQ